MYGGSKESRVLADKKFVRGLCDNQFHNEYCKDYPHKIVFVQLRTHIIDNKPCITAIAYYPNGTSEYLHKGKLFDSKLKVDEWVGNLMDSEQLSILKGAPCHILTSKGSSVSKLSVLKGATSVDIIGTDALEYLTVREFDTLCIPICSYIGGKTYIRVYPVKALLEGKWLSLDGSFAYAHDSRYTSALCEYPVPIFDRCEPF